eukprot:CAMPEP_0117041766 /NCGR_PEP_ID=MMETSP0472-20121206/29138_1 /TAXON_ID=693140 ORGANISM="Tiarina fusus, Strain LIS" /NCGR_SAMPLE_ID=MMETSP0472 /ASSEMBLY_ACC=CAM_ASM_000603 /LENGTH=204 /DNA_ID=CAMNT_0004752847 /DNA_START=22 /DNA_END=637 /DNA_ORIENTATION=+
MANHGPSYGLDAELKAKQDGKYDANLEREVIDWINALVPGSNLAPRAIHEPLKSGVVLCNLANKISPGIVRKINNGKMPFIQMENINAFLVACKQLGVPDTDLFMTVDLYEAKNMPQVIQTLHALGRHAQKVRGYSGPTIGVKLADANKREFTEQQLREGESCIPLQTAGSHGNATLLANLIQAAKLLKVQEEDSKIPYKLFDK